MHLSHLFFLLSPASQFCSALFTSVFLSLAVFFFPPQASSDTLPFYHSFDLISGQDLKKKNKCTHYLSNHFPFSSSSQENISFFLSSFPFFLLGHQGHPLRRVKLTLSSIPASQELEFIGKTVACCGHRTCH